MNALSVSSIVELDALTNGASTTYKPRNFIPLPPFLCKDVSDAIVEHEGNVKEVFLKVVNVIKNFDMKFAGNAD